VSGVRGGGAIAPGSGGVSSSSGFGGDVPGTPFAAQQGTFAGTGQLNVEFNCGTLSVGAVDGGSWRVSGSESRGRPPTIEMSGTTVSIEGRGGSSFIGDAGEAQWNVEVPRSASLGLGVTLNAGSGNARLDGASLSSVSLTLNAGSFSLDLAGAASLGDVNATVNAGDGTLSLPGGGRSANLSLNAGNLTACLPAGSPIRVEWSGALGSNDLDQAGLVEVDGNTWTSVGFDESQPHTEMHVSANAGSFHLDLGPCDA
jgi:hypothetical protein